MTNQNKILKELMIDWNELEAYRNLQNEPFNFGSGVITNDASQSEDVYWKIEQQCIESIIDDIIYRIAIKKKYKKRINMYDRREYRKRHLEKLSKYAYTIYYCEEQRRYRQFYLSGCKKFAKHCTNRKIRNTTYDFSLKNAQYRKEFDYLWTVF